MKWIFESKVISYRDEVIRFFGYKCLEMTRNLPNECVDFLGQHSETTHVDLKGFEREATKNIKLNHRNSVGRESCCKRFRRIIQRLKGLCMWEVPWIIILMSTVQVTIVLVLIQLIQ